MRWGWSINLHKNKIVTFPSNQINEHSNAMPHNILRMRFFNTSIQSWQEWREKDTLLGHWQKSLLNTTFYEMWLSFFHLRNKQALFMEHLFCVRHCSRSSTYVNSFNHFLRETFSEIMSWFLIVRFENCLVYLRNHRYTEFFHALIQQMLLST